MKSALADRRSRVREEEEPEQEDDEIDEDREEDDQLERMNVGDRVDPPDLALPAHPVRASVVTLLRTSHEKGEEAGDQKQRRDHPDVHDGERRPGRSSALLDLRADPDPEHGNAETDERAKGEQPKASDRG